MKSAEEPIEATRECVLEIRAREADEEVGREKRWRPQPLSPWDDRNSWFLGRYFIYVLIVACEVIQCFYSHSAISITPKWSKTGAPWEGSCSLPTKQNMGCIAPRTITIAYMHIT